MAPALVEPATTVAEGGPDEEEPPAEPDRLRRRLSPVRAAQRSPVALSLMKPTVGLRDDEGPVAALSPDGGGAELLDI